MDHFGRIRSPRKIDIVVGRQSSVVGGADSDSVVHPNFFNDAARIYVSQKTDIDKNFAIDHDTELSIFEGNVGRSGIGIKADAVRLIGRESINMAVQELSEIVEDLQSSLHNLAKYQNKINRALITHTHVGNLGAPTSPSTDLAPQAGLNAARIFANVTAPIIAIKYNLMFYRLKFLKKHSSNWICSNSCRLTD